MSMNHFSLPRIICIAVLATAGLGLGGFWAWQIWLGRASSAIATVSIPAPLVARTIEVPKVRFTDVTEKAGIHFRHTNGSFGRKLLPETMGSGVAFLDYDGDGRQDLLFVNSCYWPGYEDKQQPPPTLALYRNKGDGTFADVTEAAGLKVTLYGMGVTV